MRYAVVTCEMKPWSK